MRFEVLGPLVVRDRDVPVRVGGPREQKALAALLLAPDGPVSRDRLGLVLWGEEPPATASAQLHNCVAALRRALGPEVRIGRSGGGLVLDLAGHELDLAEFHTWVAKADQEPDPAVAALRYRAALALWRGDLVDGLADGAFAATAHRLQEQRLAALERCLATELQLGNGTQVAAELAGLVVDHPLRETLVEIHMRALCGSGRRSEALSVYAAARERLATELGVDPSPALQRVHTAILRDQDVPAPGHHEPVAPPTPRQLPAASPHFVGRADDLATLERLAAGWDERAAAIAAISGAPGVGKTALATQFANQVAGRFPDGQLWANLHGYDPGRTPVDPAEALRGLLEALRVPPACVPSGVDERAGLFRSLLAGRRTLVVLDNARDATQVRPLLPGAAGCLVLVTSRSQLWSLVAADGARAVIVDELSRAEARQLLEVRLGPERVAAEPAAAAELITRSGRLPLALALLAARAVARPLHPLRELAAELRGASLDALRDPDQAVDVRVSLDMSYGALPDDAARLYRLLGLHPGPASDRHQAAALAGTTVGEAQRLLQRLRDASLLVEVAPHRFGFHDLVQAHAAAAATADPEPSRRAALTRLLDHYRHAAAAAMATADPFEPLGRFPVAPAGTPTPDLSNAAVAGAWLDANLPNLVAAAGLAADGGWHVHAWQLPAILHRRLCTGGRYQEAERMHDQALTAARTTGERVGEVTALVGLGDARRLRGRLRPAGESYAQARSIADAADDGTGRLEVRIGLGGVHLLQGQPEESHEWYRQALEVARLGGYRSGELRALIGLGDVHLGQGRLDQARGRYRQALATARAVGHRQAQVQALTGLGCVHLVEHRAEPARVAFAGALTLAGGIGDRAGQLSALIGLGTLHRWQGEHDRAADRYRELLAIARTIGSRNGELEARYGLGRLRLATGDPEGALTDQQRALTLATELGHPADQARVHDGVAHAQLRLGRREAACRHWRAALEVLTRLGLDHTEDGEVSVAGVRGQLAELDNRRPGPPDRGTVAATESRP